MLTLQFVLQCQNAEGIPDADIYCAMCGLTRNPHPPALCYTGEEGGSISEVTNGMVSFYRQSYSIQRLFLVTRSFIVQ